MKQMVQPAVIKVLLVEDDPEDVLLVRDMFWWEDADRFNLIRVANLVDAARRVKGEAFDVLLLDLSLPGIKGLDGLALVRTMAPELTIVALASHDYEALALEALDNGAQDYLVKMPGNTISLSRVRQAMERSRVLATSADRGHRDPVTGLVSRHRFQAILDALYADADRDAFAVLLVDLDRFKSINDSLGHSAGDQLLASVATRLEWHTHTGEQVARLGNDEFAVLLKGVTTPDQAKEKAEEILTALGQPFMVGSHEFYVSVSVGVACAIDVGNDTDAILQAAALALAKAKDQGRHGYQIYKVEMRSAPVERLRLETALRRALERDEFVLYYQPQVNLKTGAIIGIEALLRWHHPKLGLMAPGQFIWLAEETGLIVPIGEWVLGAACAQAAAWRDMGLGPMHMVVNLSAQQFKQDNLVSLVREALEATGLPPDALGLEITEGTMMESSTGNRDTLAQLKAMGVGISIDDFGTGYSSLSYLKRIPADTLKLDRSFVKDIATDPEDAAIARAIIGMAQGLSLNVIAEGVETWEQFNILKNEGCDSIQGFLLSRPLPSRRFEKLARKGIALPA